MKTFNKSLFFLLILFQFAVNSNTKPSSHDLKAYNKLFKALNIKKEENIFEEASNLEEANTIMQKHFLRKPTLERNQLSEDSFSSEQKNEMRKIFYSIGFLDSALLFSNEHINERKDELKNDQEIYLVILGAYINTMRERILYALEMIKKNKINPTKIIILTGQRPLDEANEGEVVLFDVQYIRENWTFDAQTMQLPKNETQASEWIWHQIEKPDQIANIPIVFNSTPMKSNNARANTEDTIMNLIKDGIPSNVHMIFVSNAPFIQYQNESIKIAIVKNDINVSFSTIGKANLNTEEDPRFYQVLLDSLARFVYSSVQLNKMIEQKNNKS